MKRTLSIVLTAVMLFAMIPLSSLTAFATSNTIISVENVSAILDSTVDVSVSISGNPGIASMGFTLTFDEDLTLVGASNGEAFSEMTLTPPAQLKKVGYVNDSCRFAWLGNENVTENGTILNLKFKVAGDAQLNKDCFISITCDHGDVLDDTRTPVDVEISNGKVTIIDYTPGDVDGDSNITMMDVLTLCQFYVDGCKYDPNGYGINIKSECGDVDANGKVNMIDVLMICQYYVDGCKYDPEGYAVKLLPGKAPCEHILEKTEELAPTCTEDGNIAYWHCAKCGEYYKDANASNVILLESTVVKAKGHVPEEKASVPATTITEGYTSGIWCDQCKTWLSGHERIEPIQPNESNITYHLWYVKNDNGDIIEDPYLQQQTVNNPYPNTYVEGVGLDLNDPEKKVTVSGYDFLGWYTKPEADALRVYEIGSEEQGNRSLYAIWQKHVYKITYLPDSAGSTLQKISEENFTVDTEMALQVPTWQNLVWVGWSDANGDIIKSIPKGTAHDVTLTANWMSKRSQTVPNANYSTTKPAIVEDRENGIYAFTYEIGDIQNVPIQQVEDGIEGKGFNLVKGATHSISKTFTKKIDQSEATSVANTIANSTTKSDSWTLSENWNKSTTFSQEHSNETSQEQMSKASQTFAQNQKYSIGAGIGGSKEHTDEKGKSSKVTKSQEFGADLKLGSNVGLNVGIDGIGLSGGKSRELGLHYKNGKESTNENYEKHTDKTSVNWNLNQGFETSKSLSTSSEFSQSLKQSIRDTYKYGETLDYGGSNSNTVSSENTTSESKEYSSSVTYRTESGEELTVNEVLTGDADTGYYRKVLAANFRVFAVVVYDVKTSTFSTMTYSLKINNSEHLFTDYSTVSSFDDYENGVLPFSVPYEVCEYVYEIVGASDGLRINDETGIIEGYGYKDPETGICYKKYDVNTNQYSEPCDIDVNIPQYIVVDVDEKNKKIVKVNGMLDSAFSGTTIRSVHLNDGITIIPDSAFENCTSLEYITGSNVVEIGEKAFKNCTSLTEMVVSSQINKLGKDAFDGDYGISVDASSVAVVDSALTSNVKNLTIDVSEMTGTLDGKDFVITSDIDYFCLNGGGKSFHNLTIKSEAKTTEINNINIVSDGSYPLSVESQNLYLGFVRITANGFALNLKSDVTNVVLNGNNYITSSSDNAILSKSLIVIEKEGSTSIGKMRIAGDALVYGTLKGAQNIAFDSAEHTIKYLTEEEYNKYLTSVEIMFQPNNDTDPIISTVYYGEAYGDMPIPERDYYSFVGWFTEEDDGMEITSQTIFDEASATVLYAHWTHNPVSDWVKASERPADSEVVEQKWDYTYTSNSTYSGSDTILDQSSAWSDYGSWSGWSKTAVSGSDSRKVETKTVTDKAAYTNYKYYIYRSSDGYGYGTYGYNSSHGACTKYDEINLTYPLDLNNSSLGTYGPYNSSMFSHSYDCYWFSGGSSYVPAVTHTEYRYRDRHLIYTYNLESTSVDPTGQSGVSNVTEYVQYRAK